MAQENTILTHITAENAGFKAKMAESTAVAKQFGATLTESFSKARNMLAGGLVGSALLSELKESYESIDRIGTSAGKLGISTDGFQMLAYAAKRSDVEIGALENSIKKLRINLSRQGSTDALAALGLNRDSLNKMGTEQAFEVVIDKLKELDDASKIDIGTKLFGKNFQEILLLVNNDIKTLKQNFNELGGAVDLTGFDEIDRKVNDLDTKLTQMKQKFFMLFGGPLVEAASAGLDATQYAAKSVSGALDLKKAFSFSGGKAQDGNIFGLERLQKGDARLSGGLAGADASSAIRQASDGLFKLVDASSALDGAFKTATASLASVDLKELLGLGGQSGKDYLSSILTPVQEIVDKDFTEIATSIRDSIQRGVPTNSVSVQSGLASLKDIARSYNGVGDGQSNSGMLNAVDELTKKINATIVKPQQVEITLTYDQNGIIKAFAGSSDAARIVGNVVQQIAQKEAATTMATGG